MWSSIKSKILISNAEYNPFLFLQRELTVMTKKVLISQQFRSSVESDAVNVHSEHFSQSVAKTHAIERNGQHTPFKTFYNTTEIILT